MGLKERVVKYAAKHPGTRDDHIARALHANRNDVLQVLWQLEAEGKARSKPDRETYWYAPVKKFFGIK